MELGCAEEQGADAQSPRSYAMKLVKKERENREDSQVNPRLRASRCAGRGAEASENK